MLVAVLMAMFVWGGGATIAVADEGSESVSNITELKAALEGTASVIEIEPGTYELDSDLVIDRNVHLVGTATAAESIISGADTYSVQIESSVMLDNLTLTRLFKDYGYNMEYTDACLTINGGSVVNCQIINNFSHGGTVIALNSGTLFGNLIANNTEDGPDGWEGGGDPPDSAVAYDCVLNVRGLSFLINNTVVANETLSGSTDVVDLFDNHVLYNNIFINISEYNVYFDSGESAGDYDTNIGIDTDPDDLLDCIALFVEPTTADDGETIFSGYYGDTAVSYDWQLKSDSAAIDAGSYIFSSEILDDGNGALRFDNGAVDIGAFEFEGTGNLGILDDPSPQDVIYVSLDGSDDNLGTSWADSVATLEHAAEIAALKGSSYIFAEQGYYTVTPRGYAYVQKDGFVGGIWGGVILPEGTSFYGGFLGDETGTPEEILETRTLDTPEMGAPESSSFSVLVAQLPDGCDYIGLWESEPDYEAEKGLAFVTYGTRIIGQVENHDEEAVVDGFVLAEGYVASSLVESVSVNGVYNFNRAGGAGALIRTGTTLRNCVVVQNYEATASSYGSLPCGGGVMSNGGTIDNCTIVGNISEINGGGVYLHAGTLTDSVIVGNFAFNRGGGIVTNHHPNGGSAKSTISDCYIAGNKALGLWATTTDEFGEETLPTAYKDAMGQGGGAWIGNGTLLEKCWIEDNSVETHYWSSNDDEILPELVTPSNGDEYAGEDTAQGSGLYIAKLNEIHPAPVVQNSIIKDNVGDESTAAVQMEYGSLLNCDIIDQELPIAGSGVQVRNTVFTGVTTIDADLDITYSAFAEAYGSIESHNVAFGDNPGFTDAANGDYSLVSGSPLIDAGMTLESVKTDIIGTPRPSGLAYDIGAYEYGDWTRLAGVDRYETMSKINNTGFPTTVDTVIVTTGEKHADALAASALAGQFGAPILVTNSATLNQWTLEELDRLEPTKVYVIGGEAAVAAGVYDTIADLNYVQSIKRLPGEDRFDTAVSIFEEMEGEWGQTAIVASGGDSNFADALSISPYSNFAKAPIFLASKTTGLNSESIDAILNDGFTKVLIVGGTAAVPTVVETQLADMEVERLGGADRYETSSLLAEYSHDISDGELSFDKLVVATGEKFTDALVSGAWCGKDRKLLVLVSDTTNGQAAITGAIAAHADDIEYGYFVGGTAVISEALAEVVKEAAATGTVPG